MSLSGDWSGSEAHLSETCQDDLPHLIVAVHTTQATGSDIPALADVHTHLAAHQGTPATGSQLRDHGGRLKVVCRREQAACRRSRRPCNRDVCV